MYKRQPLQRLARLGIWAGREAGVPAFVRAPWLMAGVRRLALAHLRHQVADPALRAALTPTFQPGCKRLLLSDDFYPVLGRPEVTLVPSAVTGFDGDAVVAADGSRHPVDAVVFATGFAATRMPIAEVVHGRDGATLAQAWRADGMQALRGSTVHGFPNLFLLVGPNTGQGHTSMIYMIESQLNYLVRALDAMDAEPAVAIEPTAVAQRRWNTELARRMRRTVWATGGCASWYQDDHGRVTTLWPASTWTFRRATRRFDPAEYDVVPAELPATDDAGHR